ncbi:hypothetical protein K431DRAFT_286668 [Polychaeton citri CBS 116435]|uniref:DNA glycosylase n=1 Tax=Polychaeton citri CBS 116435 TaxID=1314669 RepID=A0A9P4Q7E6_9PEZI|nr:hypothetical protein K431DRAFT_286668 [Polychaeton citri CBS 116435]
MRKEYQADNVTTALVRELAAQYPYLAPEPLLTKPKRLDRFRYETCPKLLSQAKAEAASSSDASKPYISKDDLAKLMDWKLSHGKFRPNLSNLIQRNSPANVESTSENAFVIYDDPKQDSVHAFEKLQSLKGVGPATASLVLSVYDPENVPFFSDELYRWCFWYAGKGTGWDRRISYSWKQYSDFQYQTEQWLERLRKQHSQGDAGDEKKKIGCIELELAAFVLAKTDGQGLADEDIARLDAGEEVRGMKRKFEASESETEDEHHDANGVVNIKASSAKRMAEETAPPKPKRARAPAAQPQKMKKRTNAKPASHKVDQSPDPNLRRSGRNRHVRIYDSDVVDDDDAE